MNTHKDKKKLNKKITLIKQVVYDTCTYPEISVNKDIRKIMIEEFERRKNELECVKFNSETRAFAVAGIDLIYNYMGDVLKRAGLEPMIPDITNCKNAKH